MKKYKVTLTAEKRQYVEQAFRMSKSDLKARPIFHFTKDAIRAHIFVCFMALMMGKYLEIKTGVSLRQICYQLWDIKEAIVRDERTGELHSLPMELQEKNRLFKKPKPLIDNNCVNTLPVQDTLT